ncbi:isotrichodermin C-15 hydroxylase [Xylaria flabelliformis]|nr:isotrichodermin C-15 hydroxylase [Xylaria flabelliformis]
MDSLSPAIWLVILSVLIGTASLYVLYRGIYNVFCHPLRSYPGPWLWSASRLPYTISIFRGDATHRVKSLHDQYGQVVRIAPDSLSYTTGRVWKDVYASGQSNGSGNLPKDFKFYITPPDRIENISTASDANHRRLRRIQGHAFSEKAIALQEPYLMLHIKRFITCLRDEAAQNDGIVNITKWVDILASDAIGDLSFGESFGGLDSGQLHPWLKSLYTTTKTFTFTREILRLPGPLIKVALACVPKNMREHQEGALPFGVKVTRRRLAQQTERPDFMSYMLRHSDDEGKGMSRAEIDMAAITFIFAGSETTATMITGTVYLLVTNPSVLSKLTESIRSNFPNESDLTNSRLKQHEYLDCVLKEGLRLYPPTPDKLFRTTKGRSVVVAGKVVPPQTSITVNLWAAYRDPTNFHRALEFIPERWMKDTPPEFLNDDKTVFKPFSVGPRDCIGKNLAWAQMRLILAHLVWNFDFLGIKPGSRQWIERQKIFTLWAKLPLDVSIMPRRHQND